MSFLDGLSESVRGIGAIGLGGLVFVYNIRSPPYTPLTLLSPAIVAAIFYFGYPVVTCMMSGKSMMGCLWNKVVPDPKDAFNAVGGAVGGVVKGVVTGVVDATKPVGEAINKAFEIKELPTMKISKEPFDTPAYWQDTYNIELNYTKLAAENEFSNEQAQTRFKGRSASEAYKELKELTQTEQERTQWGAWAKWEVYKCRYHNHCTPGYMTTTLANPEARAVVQGHVDAGRNVAQQMGATTFFDKIIGSQFDQMKAEADQLNGPLKNSSKFNESVAYFNGHVATDVTADQALKDKLEQLYKTAKDYNAFLVGANNLGGMTQTQRNKLAGIYFRSSGMTR